MDVYLNLYSEYSDKRVKCSVELINESIENNGLFQGEVPSAVDKHLKEINVLLQTTKTRNQGFQLLLPLIQQGSPELIEKRIEHWYTVCCQAVISLCGASEKINACRIIIILLKAAQNFPELQKSFLSKSLNSLIHSLATADSSWNIAALECLHEVVTLIPGQCLPHKVVIEENMLKYLDTPLARVGQEDAVKRAGQVYAELPLPGMGGNKAQGRAEARGKQVTQFLALSHKTMDVLFDDIVEKEAYKHTRECSLKINPIRFDGKNSGDTCPGLLSAINRLGNTLKFISQLLTSESNQSILVVPDLVLGPVLRLLQVESTALRSYKSQEHQLLSFLIVSLHHHCLLLLRNMIISIGEAIDMYYGVISELLTSVINASFYDDSGWSGCGVQTRIIAYSVMSTLVQKSSGRHSLSRLHVRLMLRDIMPKKRQVTLQKSSGKGLQSLVVEKKKRKKGYNINKNSASSHTGPLFQSKPLCHVTRFALVLAETIISYASHSLPYKARQTLQFKILTVAEGVSGSANLPEAYACSKTRTQLYQVVAALATHPDPRCPPAYTMILHLLQRGQEDQQILVVSTCQALVRNVSFMLANPQLSQLAAALQYSQHPSNEGMEENAEDDGQVEITSNSDEDEEEEKYFAKDDESQLEESKEEEKVDQDSSMIEEAEAEEDLEDDEKETNEESGDDDDKKVMEDDASKTEYPPIIKRKEEEEVTPVNSKKNKKKGSTVKENGETTKSTKNSTKNKDNSDVLAGNHLSRETECPSKRKTKEASPISSKKSKTKDTTLESSDGVTLDDMLNSFVDADPDDE